MRDCLANCSNDCTGDYVMKYTYISVGEMISYGRLIFLTILSK